MKLFATILVASVARASASAFVPKTKEDLQSAAAMYCTGVWPEGSDPDEWVIDAITNLDDLFANYGDCNPDVSDWNVKNVSSFVRMFENNTAFNRNIGDWDLDPNADVSDIFTGACPANSTAIKVQSTDSVVFSKSQSSLRSNLLPLGEAAAFDAAASSEVILELGEIVKRCACDGDLGFNSDSECVVCADNDMVKNEEGFCETTCPTGAEQYEDSCYCTSSYEEYDEDENKCVCSRGAYGDGHGDCKKCPEHTERKSGVYAGVGDVEDRCECEEYYEVWDSDEEMCVCKEGAYGDGDGDCEKCPDGMEADEDEPGTGDKEDRCKCSNSKWTEWDDDEEKCLCKEGAYMWKDWCYKCESDMEAEEDDLGDGDIQDRCKCKDEKYIIPDGKYKCVYDCPDNEEYDSDADSCGCKRGYYGDAVGGCKKCPSGMEAADGTGVGYDTKDKRCQCKNLDTTEFVNGKCQCKKGAYMWGNKCYLCSGYGMNPSVTVPGNGNFFERCECPEVGKIINEDTWKCE